MSVTSAYRVGAFIVNEETGKVVLPGSLEVFTAAEIISIEVISVQAEPYSLISDTSVTEGLVRLKDLFVVPLSTPCDTTSIAEFEAQLVVKLQEEMTGKLGVTQVTGYRCHAVIGSGGISTAKESLDS